MMEASLSSGDEEGFPEPPPPLAEALEDAGETGSEASEEDYGRDSLSRKMEEALGLGDAKDKALLDKYSDQDRPASEVVVPGAAAGDGGGKATELGKRLGKYISLNYIGPNVLTSEKVC